MLVQPLWKAVWRFLKMLKIKLPYDPAIALLGIYSKGTDIVKRRATCSPMFIAALSTIAKLWKNRDAHQQMTGLRRCGPYIQWNITQPSERTIPNICSIMDGTGGDYAKFCKSSREKQLYGFTHMVYGT